MSLSFPDGPTLTVEIAFEEDATTTSPTWTDVTQYAAFAEWSRGRQAELEETEPGDLVLQLDNGDRRFDPSNTTGPYYPYVEPMKQVRVTAIPEKTFSIAASADDAHEEQDGTGFTSNSAIVTVNSNTVEGSRYVGGVRFPNVTIPQGAVIESAAFRAICFSTGVDDANFDIYANDVDTADDFSTTADTVSRARTTASVAFVQDGLGVSEHTSPDFTAVVQEIVDRAGWASGNALCLLLVAKSDMNRSYSVFSWDALSAATIHLDVSWRVPQFHGYVDSWPQESDGVLDGHVTLTATDASKIFANIDLPQSAFELQMQKLAPTAWYRFTESEGTVAHDSAGSDHGQYQNEPVLGLDSVIEEATDDKAWSPTTEGQRVLVSNPTLISGFPFSVSAVFRVGDDIPGSAKTVLAAVNGNHNDLQTVNVIIHGGAPFEIPEGTISTLIRNTRDVNEIRAYGDSTVIDDGRHHVLVVWDAVDTARIYVDGVAETVSYFTIGSGDPAFPDALTGWALGNYPKVSFGDFTFADVATDRLDDVAVWDGVALTAQDAADLDDAMRGRTSDSTGERIGWLLDCLGWPSDLRDIDTGNTTLGTAALSSNALDYLRLVAKSENGNIYIDGANRVVFRERHALLTEAVHTTSQATFSDDGDDLSYEGPPTFDPSDKHIRNDVTVQRQSGAPQRITDATSISRYQRRGFSRTGLLHASDNESLDQASWLVSHYASPLQRVRSLVVRPLGGADADERADLWEQVLERDLQHRITVEYKPFNVGAQISQAALIEHLRQRVTPFVWETTYTLSPANTQTYLVLNDATLGKLSSGNRLAY